MTKEYKVPVSWQMYGTCLIEAESWDEAVAEAEDDDCPLPQGDYVDASFEVDHDMIEFEKEEERQRIRRKVDEGGEIENTGS